MAVEALGGVNTAQATTVPKSVVSQEEFLKILLTQLQFQDPLKPLDNEQFVAQLAQFTSLEQTKEMNDGINTLLTIQSSTQSIGLIGKTVDIATASGDTVTGQVTTISFASGQPRLTVNANGSFLTDISLSQISLVR